MGNIMESLKKVLGIDDSTKDLTKRPVWRKLNILIIIASAGILLIVLANTFGSSEKSPDITPNTDLVQDTRNGGQTVNTAGNADGLEVSLAQRLEKVLAMIDGVGEIEVTVNLASSSQKDYAINTNTNNKTTKEQDQKGGNRVITETNENGQMVLVRENQGSKEEPVIVKETKPEVKGVIVVAEGASDPLVKADLMKAVQVYLDIPLYKVIVLAKEESR